VRSDGERVSATELGCRETVSFDLLVELRDGSDARRRPFGSRRLDSTFRCGQRGGVSYANLELGGQLSDGKGSCEYHGWEELDGMRGGE
jgi:hypothetical protein